MATYNFTVRATDNSGAFADRNFAMTVNNTQIDRFIAVGATGLARSQDGINWNVENTLTGNNVRWENNQWIVSHLVGQTNNTTPFNVIRSSPDGINWKSVNATFGTHRMAYTAPASFANTGTAVIKYRKGAYVMFASVLVSSVFNVDEFTSSDLVTWNGVRNLAQVSNSTNNAYDGVWDFEYDSVSDTWIALLSFASGATVFRRIGTGAWTEITTRLQSYNSPIPLNASSTPATSRYMGKVFFQNGLWVIANGQTGIWTSVDAQNWVYRDTLAASASGIGGICYSNGRILACPMTTSGTGGTALLQSINAGHTWTQRVIASGTPFNYGAVAMAPTYNIMDTYAGTTLVSQSGRLASVSTTKDDGLNWTPVSIGIGVIHSLAARNT